MSRTSDLETALRSLDAADRHPVLASARAASDLERILATGSSPTGRPPRARHAVRRFALATGLLAAVTVGVVALPSLSGGDRVFASWTPAPEAVSAPVATEAADGCRRLQQDGAGAGYADQLRAAAPVIAERRGEWTTVVLAGADGFSALCITDGSSPFFARDAIGAVGTPTGSTAPLPRGLTATSLGTGTTAAGTLSLAVGRAGADVVGVAYRSPSRGEVAATLSRGHFALWLPGDELQSASRDGVQLDVAYRDGSTGSVRLVL